MTTPTTSTSTSTTSSGSTGAVSTTSAGGGGQLDSSQGKTTIADPVVAKVARIAAQEVPGVYGFGGGAARAFGAITERIPGGRSSNTRGVSVEVGERQAAIDLDVVTYYGQSIVEVTEAVRRNVIDRVEGMTGLEVTEVNVAVDDLYIEGEPEEPKEPRVQ